MAGLKGLGPTPKAAVPEGLTKEAREFIGAASLKHQQVEEKAKPIRKFVRKHFSIDAQVEALVDRASMLPRTFRVTRSGALRAAVRAFAELSEEQQLSYLKAETEGAE